jgi:hypothetical protein
MANPEWNRSLGEPGDLADVIVAVFSLARTDHEVVKVSRHDLYDIFWSLQQEFPSLLPKMVFTRTGDYLYSKTLSVALEHALRLGVDPLNPRFCYFGIRDSTDAQRNLQLLRERVGEGFIEKMKPMADRFAGIVNSVPAHETTASPCEESMKEIEITFKKRFKMCDDQDPKDCARMYIETMGFEVVDIQDLNGPKPGDIVEHGRKSCCPNVHTSAPNVG